MHKKDQGKLGEALVIAQCLRNQLEVFTDFGDNSRIDLVLNTAQGLIKVQVKCVGREKHTPNSANLYLYKTGPNYAYRYQVTDVDYFAVVDLETGRIAWIKVTEDLCAKYQLQMRMDDKQHKSIRYRFADYEQFPFGPLVIIG